ncbi:unnamed protein product [Durusdinium trenchii]|uniref:Uncharacterized protein n=1 Tax=Durusdinium trenchii TaxID=1381693 RepID=A0ABP0NCH4_9DINO
MPVGPDPEECRQAIAAFTEATKCHAQAAEGEKTRLPANSFQWRQYRQATKCLLAAFANSLRHCLPAQWSFKSLLPPNLLEPAGRQGVREKLLDEEAKMFGVADDRKLFFRYSFDSHEACPDFFIHEDFYRLIFSADEGTEGFLGFLHLANNGLYCLFWPDIFHRVSRRVAQAINHPSCQDAKDLLRRCTKMFRFSRAPFGSGRFGSEMNDARKKLLESVREGECEELLEMYMHAVARDRGRPVDTFSRHELVEVLQNAARSHHILSAECKDSRWMSFHEHCERWDSRWHVELMCHAYAWFMQGKNPWDLAGAGSDDSPENTFSHRLNAWNVLLDDSNQNKVRSIIAVFKPFRQFLGQADMEMQRKPTASVAQAVYLATGRTCQKLVSQTISSSVSAECLLHIGLDSADDDESQELLQFHGNLLLSVLASICDLDRYHTAFPWRLVACLDKTSVPSTLKDMAREWQFVTEFVDQLAENDLIRKTLMHTRWQAYRDAMSKAEHFDFDPKRLTSDEAQPFLDTVRCVIGITSEKPNATDSVLSSLSCELYFNDLRDACRRHAKKERQNPSNYHCISMKSVSVRNSGCKSFQIEDHQWQHPIPRKQIQQQVLSATRVSDRTLGNPSHGLTKAKTTGLTKPHILTQRLDLMKCLECCWHECSGNVEQKRAAAMNGMQKLWMSKLVCEQGLIRVKGSDQINLVLRAGPWNVRIVSLVGDKNTPDAFLLTHNTDVMTVTSLDEVEIALAKPTILQCGTLGFQKAGEWMSLVAYTVTEDGILACAAQTLQRLCACLKVKGHGGLTHKLRVELFLRWNECSEDFIQRILDMIPDVVRKRKCEDDATEGDKEEDRLEGQSEDEEMNEIVDFLLGSKTPDDAEGDGQQVEPAVNEKKSTESVAELDGETRKDPAADAASVRADADGTHAPHVPRGRPQGSFPPGVKSYFGSPQGASPFVQVYLPTGFLHLGKKSKCLSFADPQSKDGNKRSTLRSREAALLGVQAFAWDWYSSLTEIQKSSIAEADAAVQERPLKRARL